MRVSIDCTRAFRSYVKDRKKRDERKNKEKKKHLVDDGLDQWTLGDPLWDVAAKKEQVTAVLAYKATFVVCFTGSGAGQA